MRTGTHSTRSRLLGGLALLALAGCGGDGTGAGPELGPGDAGSGTVSELRPGVGIVVEGTEVALGDPRTVLEDRLGPPPRSRDLDALGVRLEYPERGLTLSLAGPAPQAPVTAIEVAAPFEGLTTEGVGLGSTEEAVSGLCPVTIRDPFQGSWWCPAEGLAFQWDGPTVARITLVGSGPR